MLDPETGAILFVVGGLGTLVSFVAYGVAQQLGPKLELGDLLPAPPWVGLPLPMFVYKKPELLEELKKR